MSYPKMKTNLTLNIFGTTVKFRPRETTDGYTAQPAVWEIYPPAESKRGYLINADQFSQALTLALQLTVEGREVLHLTSYLKKRRINGIP